ncbi:MAG: arylesterase [Desulfarculus sp.]|nr:arylesterase [Desulfarculus sp.]
MNKRLVLLALAGLCLALLAPALSPGQVTILAFGDSLTAGYGLAQEEAFPAVLEGMLRAEGIKVRVINAGLSGETTAGGRARLASYLKDPPQAAILELGANDCLRGLDPAAAEENLSAMLHELTSRGVKVLLAGMLAPSYRGEPYVKNFNAIYPRLAQRFGVDLYPFFLAGVWEDQRLTMDGLHPTAKGVRVIAQGIYPQAKRLALSVLEGQQAAK